jgi:hypothetical protein
MVPGILLIPPVRDASRSSSVLSAFFMAAGSTGNGGLVAFPPFGLPTLIMTAIPPFLGFLSLPTPSGKRSKGKKFLQISSQDLTHLGISPEPDGNTDEESESRLRVHDSISHAFPNVL